MAILSRAQRVSEVFVKMANTLVAEYDVVDLLHTLVDESIAVLDAAAAGLLLIDPAGDLQVMASTCEKSQLVEILQLEAGVGPCVDCFRTGTAVSIHDIAAEGNAWPQFRDSALSQGFADVATIGILQERASRESTMVNEQLQRALSSRIVIEQAKGVIAHTANVSIDQAFVLFRSCMPAPTASRSTRSHRASWNASSPLPPDGLPSLSGHHA